MRLNTARQEHDGTKEHEQHDQNRKTGEDVWRTGVQRNGEAGPEASWSLPLGSVIESPPRKRHGVSPSVEPEAPLAGRAPDRNASKTSASGGKDPRASAVRKAKR